MRSFTLDKVPKRLQAVVDQLGGTTLICVGGRIGEPLLTVEAASLFVARLKYAENDCEYIGDGSGAARA